MNQENGQPLLSIAFVPTVHLFPLLLVTPIAPASHVLFVSMFSFLSSALSLVPWCPHPLLEVVIAGRWVFLSQWVWVCWLGSHVIVSVIVGELKPVSNENDVSQMKI